MVLVLRPLTDLWRHLYIHHLEPLGYYIMHCSFTSVAPFHRIIKFFVWINLFSSSMGLLILSQHFLPLIKDIPLAFSESAHIFKDGIGFAVSIFRITVWGWPICEGIFIYITWNRWKIISFTVHLQLTLNPKELKIKVAI